MMQHGCSKMDYHCLLFFRWWFLCMKMGSVLGKLPMKLVTVAIVQIL